jgi:hypothetical protein
VNARFLLCQVTEMVIVISVIVIVRVTLCVTLCATDQSFHHVFAMFCFFSNWVSFYLIAHTYFK